MWKDACVCVAYNSGMCCKHDQLMLYCCAAKFVARPLQSTKKDPKMSEDVTYSAATGGKQLQPCYS